MNKLQIIENQPDTSIHPMLRFFRKIRFKQFTNNKIRQYLIYAIGEVFLVILGILVAVNLNNINERSKERAEIENLLRQAQTELNANIQRIDGLYLNYGLRDSLFYTFINEIVPTQTLDDRFVGTYASLTMNYASLEVESAAYEALMKKAQYFPETYTPLILNLKTLYRQNRDYIESSLNLILNNINDEMDYLGETQSWYTDFFYRNQVKKEVKSFILTDTRFINKMTDYVNLSSGNLIPAVLSFKQLAIDSYRQIEELLPPSNSSTTTGASFEYDFTDYESWIGKYRDPTDSDTIEIVSKEGLIHMLWGSNEYELFPLNKRDFNMNYPFFVKMNYNTDGSVKAFRGHSPNSRFVYEKIE